MKGIRSSWVEQLTLNLLRIGSGFLLLGHGAQKLFGVLGGGPPVEILSWPGLQGGLETLGGGLLVLGLATRPVAVALAAWTAWTYLRVNAPQGLLPIVNGGEGPALHTLLYLYLAARGGGAFSVDGVLGLVKPRAALAPAKEAPPAVAAGKPRKEAAPPPPRELTEADLEEDPEVAALLRGQLPPR